MIHIITHRGLDSTKKDYFVESSYEAFKDQLKRGYGLEFDLQLTEDSKIVISHDSDFSRISKGKESRAILEMTEEEILNFNFNGCHIASLSDLFGLIKKYGSKNSIHAIHLKRSSQTKELLDYLLEKINEIDYKNIIFFDTTPETAKYMKERKIDLNIAPSVAHPYDIERYNDAVGGTLMSPEQALSHSDLFNWVWLDEWDRTDENKKTKKFYTKELFEKLRNHGFKIALVTPELHRTSPKLLGGESHPDALNQTRLFDRIKEIISLHPDAICTDYPDQYDKLL